MVYLKCIFLKTCNKIKLKKKKFFHLPSDVPVVGMPLSDQSVKKKQKIR